MGNSSSKKRQNKQKQQEVNCRNKQQPPASRVPPAPPAPPRLRPRPVVEKPSKSAEEYKVEGNRAFKNGDYASAIASYTSAITVNNSDSTFYSNRAQCYFKTNEFENSFIDSNQAISLNPQNIKAHILISRSALKMFMKTVDLRILLKSEESCRYAINYYEERKEKANEKFAKELHKQIKVFQKIYHENETEMKIFTILGHYDKVLRGNSLAEELREMLSFKKQSASDCLSCCITFEIYTEPVVTAEGITYEKKTIENYLKNSVADPVTRRILPSKKLIPNRAMKKVVKQLRLNQPWDFYDIPKGDYPNFES